MSVDVMFVFRVQTCLVSVLGCVLLVVSYLLISCLPCLLFCKDWFLVCFL